MNRREFVAGVGAGVLATYGGLAAATPAKSTKVTKRTPKILYVCRSQSCANELRDKYSEPFDKLPAYFEVKYIGAGAMLCGEGFDLINLVGDWAVHFPSYMMANDYLDSHLRTRLFPGGVIRYV